MSSCIVKSSKGEDIDVYSLDKQTRKIYISSKIHDVNQLKEYIRYELIDSKLKFSNERFQADYGYGLVWYSWLRIWYCPNGWENPKERQLYRVLVERPDAEELKRLAKYCECKWHQANWFNKFFICKCCVGCLDEDDWARDLILKARKKLIDAKVNNSK
jgi:hypothetical protein